MSEAFFHSGHRLSNQKRFQQSSVKSGSRSAEKLLRDNSSKNIVDVVNSFVANYLSTGIGGYTGNSDMPQFMSDDLQEVLDSVSMEYSMSTVPAQVQYDVMSVLYSLGGQSSTRSRESVEDVLDGIIKMVIDALRQETEESTGRGGRGNWLQILAKALGSTAGDQLKKMLEGSRMLGTIDQETNPEAFAQTKSELQAAAQIFKLFQEAISTVMKSIGEGVASVARRQ